MKTEFRLKLIGLASVAQLDVCATGDREIKGLIPHQVQQYFFVEIDHEIFSVAILSLLLIQGGQFSVK